MGLLVRLWTNSRQALSSYCTSVVSWTCLPAAILRSCCTLVNMTLDPAKAGVMLHKIPRSLRHLRREVVQTFPGMTASAAATFSCCLGGRRSRWEIVSRSHPRTVFQVYHAPSPCPRLFRDMDYLRLVYASLLGRNTCSIWWKRCLSIWRLSLGPPCTTEMKSSR